MSAQEMIRKLTLAITDYRGRKTPSGKCFRPPNKTAKARVDRWAFRCRRAGLLTEAQEKNLRSLETLKLEDAL